MVEAGDSLKAVGSDFMRSSSCNALRLLGTQRVSTAMAMQRSFPSRRCTRFESRWI
jgi:hypothetical protein